MSLYLLSLSQRRRRKNPKKSSLHKVIDGYSQRLSPATIPFH
jgi:hypothetical protein